MHDLRNPTDFPVVDSKLKALGQCICKKMVVADDKTRASIDQVIGDEAFRDYFPFVEAKAKAWQYEEALDEMENQHLQQQISKLKETISSNKKRFNKSLSEYKKQLDDSLQQLKEEVEERNKLQRVVEQSNLLIERMNERLKQVEGENKRLGQQLQLMEPKLKAFGNGHRVGNEKPVETMATGSSSVELKKSEEKGNFAKSNETQVFFV